MSYIIENISTKEVNTKFGPKPAYSVVANGERYSYGFKKPAFKIGDEVDFQYTENTYGKNIDHASVRLLKKGEGGSAAPAATSSPARASYGSPKVFPIPPLHGDRAIVRQNSITNATKLVSDALCNGKKEVDLAAAAEQIISIARMFEAYSCGDIEALAAEEMSNEKD